jgi:hypothetical protein
MNTNQTLNLAKLKRMKKLTKELQKYIQLENNDVRYELSRLTIFSIIDTINSFNLFKIDISKVI